MTTVNITTSTDTININNNTDQTINPNTCIPTKVCKTCRIIKYITEFHKDKSISDGYKNQCKNCISNRYKEYNTKHKDDLIKYRKEYNEANKDIISQKCKEYYKINKDKILKNTKEYYETNKENILTRNKEYYNQNIDRMHEISKEHYKANKDKYTENHKIYYNQNKDEILNHQRVYKKNKRHTDPINRLIINNRTRIRLALKSKKKATNTIELLKCDGQFFYKWIQFQLPYEMNDDEFKKLYDVDHVRPISSFDLSIEGNQFEAFVWTNCCPLLKHKNLSKGAKRNLWLELLQEMKVVVFLKLYYPEFCLSNVEES